MVRETQFNTFLAQTYLVQYFSGANLPGYVFWYADHRARFNLDKQQLNILLRLNISPYVASGLFIIQEFLVVVLSAADLRLGLAVAGL
jgi:hypothetical protein